MSPRVPKEIEDAIIAAYLNGATKEEAAALFGYSSKVCHNALKRRGIKARNVSEAMFASSHIRRIPEEHEEAMVASYLASSTAMQAAAQFGYSETSCYQALRKRGIASRSPSESYRMPSAHEDAIVAAYLAGSSAEQAAAQFGYSQSTGQNVLRRRGIPTRSPSETHRRYALDESFFECINTPDKAYWLGFLSADGVIGDRFVRIHLKLGDVDHLRKFAASLQSEQPVSFRKNVTNGVVSTQAMIIISSPRLAQSLYRLGVTTKKTFIVRPCEEVPESLLADYWRGVFDGDGSIGRSGLLHTKWQVSLVGNKAMVEGFREFIARFVHSNASVRPTASIFRVTYFGRAMPRAVAQVLYENATIYLDRKYALAKELCGDL